MKMESQQLPKVADEQDVSNDLVEILQDEAVVVVQSEDDLTLTEDENSGQEHLEVIVKEIIPAKEEFDLDECTEKVMKQKE